MDSESRMFPARASVVALLLLLVSQASLPPRATCFLLSTNSNMHMHHLRKGKIRHIKRSKDLLPRNMMMSMEPYRLFGTSSFSLNRCRRFPSLRLFVGESTCDKTSRFLSDLGGDDTERRTDELSAHAQRIKALRLANSTNDELIPNISSLLCFMHEHPYGHSATSSIVQQFQHHDALVEAAVQAMRAAAKFGNYRLVISVMDKCIQYANDYPILSPRIFGEGIAALSKTRANLSKIKYAWRLVAQSKNTTGSYLQGPVSAFELNVMIDALAKRGAVRACLDLVQKHISGPEKTEDLNNVDSPRGNETEGMNHGPTEVAQVIPDAYTASAIFSVLANSVAQNQTSDMFMESVQLPQGATPFQTSLARIGSSSFWQWREAIKFMNNLPPESEWNNHVYRELLELHHRIISVDKHPTQANSIRTAFVILQNMVKNNCWPNVIACTIAMKIVRTASSSTSWQVAIQLLDQMISNENLPNPNVYTYTEAIVACARSRRFLMAKQLLQDMRKGTSSIGNNADFVPPSPNTWVYNGVLLAVFNLESTQKKGQGVKLSKRIQKQEEEKCQLALDILNKMKFDCRNSGFDTCPDSVTYNTIFAIFGTTLLRGANITTDMVFDLLKDMEESNIAWNSITYCNAISALSDSTAMLQILRRAISDSSSDGHFCDGESLKKVSNAALSTLATFKDELGLQSVIEIMGMVRHKVDYDEDTVTEFIRAYLNCASSPNATLLISALDGTCEVSVMAQNQIRDEHSFDLSQLALPFLKVRHYSSTIGACLANNDLEQARQVFADMRNKGLSPKADCLESFVRVYARLALKLASTLCNDEATKLATIKAAQSRAHSAYTIAMSLDQPPHHTMCTVANACAKTGLWKETHRALDFLHDDMVKNYKDAVPFQQRSLNLLFDLHRTLLLQCARQGDVRRALRVVDCVQKLRARLRSLEHALSKSPLNSQAANRRTLNPFSAMLSDISTADKGLPSVFLGAKDWILLLTAAQKSGHWRVCLSTLQFLQPFIEDCHPSKARDHADISHLRADYEQLSLAFVRAVRCFEQRSQYGWAVRSIEDWMVWSGRRPHAEAVLAATRVLCNRSCGDQVSTLLTQCVSMAPHKCGTNDSLYDEQLCFGAITSLHRAGLYDDADSVFIMALSRGCDYLRLTVNEGSRSTLDLRGLNVALAHSAVRVALQKYQKVDSDKPYLGLIIVTGRGRNLAIPMRPILCPEVQRMLLEEFFPPINTISVPGNMGALFVSEADIAAWQLHQRRQKDARMLAIAATIKNLSGARFRRNIAKVVSLSNGPKDTDAPA